MTTIEPEVFEVTEPIKIYCIAAKSFPDDVMYTHQKLHEQAPINSQRKYFGVSWGGQTITYKAGATEIDDGELKNKGLEEFVIGAGKYLSVMLDNTDEIAQVFGQLIKDPRIDQQSGYCVEMYLDDNKIRCMVTMKG